MEAVVWIGAAANDYHQAEWHLIWSFLGWLAHCGGQRPGGINGPGGLLPPWGLWGGFPHQGLPLRRLAGGERSLVFTVGLPFLLEFNFLMNSVHSPIL